MSSLTDAQMKSLCELLLARAKLPLKPNADDLGLFQAHVTPCSGWIPPPAGQTSLLCGSLKRRKLFPKFHFTGTINCIARRCSEKCSCALQLRSLILHKFVKEHRNQPQNTRDERMSSLRHRFCAVVWNLKSRELYSWDVIHVASLKLHLYKTLVF